MKSSSSDDVSEPVVRFAINADEKSHTYKNEILVKDVNSMLAMLQTKHNSIKRLKVDGYDLSRDDAETISHHIAQNASTSLIELSVDFLFDDYLLVAANHTFANVKSLSIIGGHQSDVLRLHEIFPNIEKLFLFRTNERPMESLQRQYPQLIELSFYSLDYDNVNLQPLIQLNPQIRHLKLNAIPNIATLECIEQYLPNLETLNIQCNARGCDRQYFERIHMSHVKHFIINLSQRDTKRIPITFERLESLQIDGKFVSDAAARLIENNRFVRKLALPSVIMAEEFKRVVDMAIELPTLKEITLAWWGGFDPLDVHRLFDAANHLYVVRFIVDRFCREKFMVLASSRWKLVSEVEIDVGADDDRSAIQFTFFRRFWYAVTPA